MVYQSFEQKMEILKQHMSMIKTVNWFVKTIKMVHALSTNMMGLEEMYLYQKLIQKLNQRKIGLRVQN